MQMAALESEQMLFFPPLLSGMFASLASCHDTCERSFHIRTFFRFGSQTVDNTVSVEEVNRGPVRTSGVNA